MQPWQRQSLLQCPTSFILPTDFQPTRHLNFVKAAPVHCRRDAQLLFDPFLGVRDAQNRITFFPRSRVNRETPP